LQRAANGLDSRRTDEGLTAWAAHIVRVRSEASPDGRSRTYHVLHLVARTGGLEVEARRGHGSGLCPCRLLIWIDGTNRRFDGYSYLPGNPESMIAWFGCFIG
jgi:hypothetical protein